MSRWKATVFLALVLAVPCAAQSAIYTENFDGVAAGTLPAGWSADAATGSPAVGWKVDNLPGTDGLSTGKYAFGGGCYGLAPIPASFSPGNTRNTAPNSLNFNNDVDTENGGLFAGSAMSPPFTLSSTVGTKLSFYCYFEGLSCDTQVAAAKFGTDQKFVEIMDAAGTTVVMSFQLVVYNGTAPAVITPRASWPAPPAGLDVECTELGVPHFHTIDLSTLPAGTYRVRFRSNEIVESTAAATVGPDTHWIGWFIDTIAVTCPLADLTAPTAPTLLTPADTTCTTSPVSFDWTDATDTAPCGPGIITSYRVEVDTVNTFPAPTVFIVTGTSSLSAPFLPGTYFWRVRATDGGGNNGPFSSTFSFTAETPLAPLPPDSLFVNTSLVGAQSGDSGFVDPVADEQPHFSAIYRDPNCADLAVNYHMQVSQDPTFTVVDFDSGLLALGTAVPKDSRCQDLLINISLQRDTVYYWRVLFGDATGPGAYSLAQSFHVGNDFDFGVREGSTHHGRKCWIATAAWGSAEAAPVQALQQWRFGSMESIGAGQLASRFYHVSGAAVSAACVNSTVARAATLPLSWAGRAALPVFVVGLAIVLLGAFRVGKSS